MRRTLLSISYGNKQETTRIVTLKVVDGVEYAVLENGDDVRLDLIQEVLEA
ncbi:hypothetical protein MY04_2288 [Flammeovirga sp. MY04]|nr:hypothetical protein MY04_2288 [Flammeovirga sp. MY04]